MGDIVTLATREWHALQLERSWDARWDDKQAREAVLRAEEQVLAAKASLEQVIRCVEVAALIYSDAISWSFTAREMRVDLSEKGEQSDG